MDEIYGMTIFKWVAKTMIAVMVARVTYLDGNEYKVFESWNTCENCFNKMTNILSRPPWVNCSGAEAGMF